MIIIFHCNSYQEVKVLYHYLLKNYYNSLSASYKVNDYSRHFMEINTDDMTFELKAYHPNHMILLGKHCRTLTDVFNLLRKP